MEELKPCKNCGNKPRIVKFYIKGTPNRLHYFVECETCHIRPYMDGKSFRKPENAIKRWNRSVEEYEIQSS